MNTSVLNASSKVIRSARLFMLMTAGGKIYYMHKIAGLKANTEYSFKNCSSPFRKDKNPSFSITCFRDKNVWGHTDFGDTSQKGNVFDFAAQIHGLDVKNDFPALLDKIYEDLKIDDMDKNELERLMNFSCGTNEEIRFNFKIPILNPVTKIFEEEDQENDSEYIYEIILSKIDEKNLNSEHKKFINDTGIKYEVMQEYNAFFIDKYTIVYGKEGYGGAKHRSKKENEIWICYSFGKYCKIYSPNPKKIWYIGKVESRYIFGTPNIHGQLGGETVILAAGEKDVLSLLSRGYHAMCLSSEVASVTRSDNKYWYYDCHFRVMTIYDLDDTGFKQSSTIKNEAGIPFLLLPQWVKDKGGKDITDFFELGGTNEELDLLLKQFENQTSAEVINIKLPVRTAAQRIRDAQSQPDILPHADVLFQTNELTIFFGDTGKGKSIFAVALANAISKGITFLGLENKCEKQKVLYYDFELSDKQFEKRYTSENGEPYVFHDNFFIDNIDLSGIDLSNKKIPFDEHLIKK